VLFLVPIVIIVATVIALVCFRPTDPGDPRHGRLEMPWLKRPVAIALPVWLVLTGSGAVSEWADFVVLFAIAITFAAVTAVRLWPAGQPPPEPATGSEGTPAPAPLPPRPSAAPDFRLGDVTSTPTAVVDATPEDLAKLRGLLQEVWDGEEFVGYAAVDLPGIGRVAIVHRGKADDPRVELHLDGNGVPPEQLAAALGLAPEKLQSASGEILRPGAPARA